VAHSGLEDNSFFGWQVLGELTGHISVGGLMAMALSGRRWPAEDLALFDVMMATCTLGDPRIWPLKAARLGACHGRSLQGVALGVLIQDCQFVGGPSASPRAAELLLKIQDALREGGDDSAALVSTVELELAKERHLGGFGVPFRETDARLSALRDHVYALDRQGGTYWRLHEVVVDVVRRTRRVEPNVAAGVAALCLDLGLTVAEILPMSLLMTLPTVLANAFEESMQRNPTMRQLPADRVRYVGVQPRLSPRASAER
jgi:hypothetical protein